MLASLLWRLTTLVGNNWKEEILFLFFYSWTFSRWLPWILLLPVLTWSPCRIRQRGHVPIKTEMGDTALEQLLEKYISTCGKDPKQATRPVEKCSLLLHRKGVFYESMINATGVPFPFSPTSPLWFHLATVLKHWQTACTAPWRFISCVYTTLYKCNANCPALMI